MRLSRCAAYRFFEVPHSPGAAARPALKRYAEYRRAYNLLDARRVEATIGLCKRVLKGGRSMLWTIFVILLVLWLLGLVSSYTLGGYIHILLVIALVVLILQLVSGRRSAL
jgi:hypothetical protein